MSKNKGGGSKAPAPPAPPVQENEYFYVGDQLQSQRTKGTGPDGQAGWVTRVNQTPEERAIEQQSTQFISDLIPQAQKAFDMSPEGQAKLRSSYVDPQMRALNSSYNDALGAATNAASSSGMRNSIGFLNYKMGKLDRQKAEGAADIEANAELMMPELQRGRLAPFADAFNLYNAALSGEQANQMSNVNPAMQGQAQSNAFNMGNYANQLNFYNTKYQQQQGGRNGNFLGWLVGANSLY